MKLMTEFMVFMFVIITGFVSCSEPKSVMTKEELISYINRSKNGLSAEQEVNGVKVNITYRPASLMVVQEIGENEEANKNLIDSLTNKYSSSYYFFLKFSKNGKELIRQLGDFSRYSDMVQVFSFKMGQFVNLTTPEKDTIMLSDYFFDQNYGMSDGNTILLCFDKSKLKNKNELNINVAECGLGIGNLRFSFSKEKLDKTPCLDYDRL